MSLEQFKKKVEENLIIVAGKKEAQETMKLYENDFPPTPLLTIRRMNPEKNNPSLSNCNVLHVLYHQGIGISNTTSIYLGI